MLIFYTKKFKYRKKDIFCTLNLNYFEIGLIKFGLRHRSFQHPKIYKSL